MSDSPVSKIESRSPSDIWSKLLFALNITCLVALSLFYVFSYASRNVSSGQFLAEHILLSLGLTLDQIKDIMTLNLDTVLKITVPFILLDIFFTFGFMHIFYFAPLFCLNFFIYIMIMAIFHWSLGALTHNLILGMFGFTIFMAFITLVVIYGKNQAKVAFFFKSTLYMLYNVKAIISLHLLLFLFEMLITLLLFFPLDHLLASFSPENTWAFVFQNSYISFSASWISISMSIFLQMVSTTLVSARLYPQTGTSSLFEAIKRSWNLHLGQAIKLSFVLALMNTFLILFSKSVDSLIFFVPIIIFSCACDISLRIIAVNIALFNKGVGGAIGATLVLLKRCPKSVICTLSFTSLAIFTPLFFSTIILIFTITLLKVGGDISSSAFKTFILKLIEKLGVSIIVLFVAINHSIFILYKNDKNCVQHLPGYDELMLPLKKKDIESST